MVSRLVATDDPGKVFLLTQDWINGVLAASPGHRPLDRMQRQAPPDALLRLMKSSGTTGVPKVMGMTQGLLQRQIQKLLLHAAPQVAIHPDFLCMYGFSVRGAYTRAMLTLQLGSAIHLTGSDEWWETVSTGTGNYILFVSGDLKRFIRTIPYGQGPFWLHIDVIGGAVSARLRQEIRGKLTDQIRVTYSSNEAHHVSLVDDDNVGTLFPDVQVKIVDDSGRTLPLGQRGSIRVKTNTMIQGYIDAPELDKAAFIDGWYETNDFGYQPTKQTLVVLGRADDMLNIGGVQLAPAPIEERLKAIEGISDALLTSVDDDLETNVMLVAIETGGDPADVGRRIASIIQGYVSYFRLIVLRAFPRTETGKIRREAVKDLYRAQARSL